MKFSTLGVPAKRPIGNPRQDRLYPAGYLAHREQLKVAAIGALRRTETSRLAKHQRRNREFFWISLEGTLQCLEQHRSPNLSVGSISCSRLLSESL